MILSIVISTLTVDKDSITFTSLACDQCTLEIQQNDKPIMSVHAKNYVNGANTLQVADLQFSGPFNTVFDGGAEAALIFQATGQSSRTELEEVVISITACPDKTYLDAYKDKIDATAAETCSYEGSSVYVVFKADDVEVHKFKKSNFKFNASYTDADNVATSGVAFYKIVQRVVKAKEMQLFNGQKLLCEFVPVFTIKEDLDGEKMQLWKLILIIVAVIVVVIVIIVLIIYCAKRTRGTDKYSSEEEGDDGDKLYGETDEELDLQECKSLSREFGSKEFLGEYVKGQLSTRLTKNKNSSIIIDSSSQVLASYIVSSDPK